MFNSIFFMHTCVLGTLVGAAVDDVWPVCPPGAFPVLVVKGFS